MSGPVAAELFYDTERFQRSGAAPEPLRATLFGKGGVQTLDGSAHALRKAMFVSLTTPGRVEALAARVQAELMVASSQWRIVRQVSLYDELQLVLTRAVCAWAGVPLMPQEHSVRAAQLSSLFNDAASSIRHHFRARLARKQAEEWLTRLVESIRAHTVDAPEDSAARTVALHRDLDGRFLPPSVAAVELLNVLRPTVAVSVFIVFAAHALQAHPECRARLQAGDAKYIECFAQEVRRWYPFFPAVAALVRHDFEWQGHVFRRGARAMLDLYGTNHDPRAWDAPELFEPERFQRRRPSPYEFIPQGGADVHRNHRCPGEGIAMALIEAAVDFLVNRVQYRVPPRSMELDFSRLPALPRDGFVMEPFQTTA
jgi:fatty-acid peroxygenase